MRRIASRIAGVVKGGWRELHARTRPGAALGAPLATTVVYAAWGLGTTRALFDEDRHPYNQEEIMLWTIAVVLIALWLLGLMASYTMGGLIHILLVIAVISVLLRVIQGRRVV